MKNSTALGAKEKTTHTITFKSKQHENFYQEYLSKDRYQDVYYKALVYCLGISEDTRNHVDNIYDFKTGNELTVYELYLENLKIKDFTFAQKFFKIHDILDILDNKWSYNLANSNDSQTRNNSQKHIMILRKK